MSELAEVPLIFDTRATIDRRIRKDSLIWLLWLSVVTGVSLLIGLRMVLIEPTPAVMAWLIFFAGLAAIIYQPRYGVYLIIFFSLLGDKGLMYWYPFHLNFSSVESIFYLNPRLIISPMEVYLGVTFLSWLLRAAILRSLRIHQSELFWHALIFLAFIVFGLGYGMMRGGDVNIGLWEARPIFYLPLMLILTSNLLTERRHISAVMWFIVVALSIEGIIGANYRLATLNQHIVVEMVMEHPAGVQMDSFFVFAIALWLYKTPWKGRIFTLLMAVPIVISYLMIQRRAAFSALAIALFFLAFILYKENRRAFWIIVPLAALGFAGIVAAGWNSQGFLGFPARAIKSQFFPQLASMRDQASDVYRIIENYNILYTIRTAPLTGIGFGQMFIMAISLPDISFFVWYRYITHNSIGYIWMKTGVLGFIAMLFLVGLSIMTGVRVLSRRPGGMLSAAVLTATLYIVMHFIFAYVDMSWDNQSMVYIGTAMGIITCAETFTGSPSLIKSRANPGFMRVRHA